MKAYPLSLPGLGPSRARAQASKRCEHMSRDAWTRRAPSS